MLNGNDGPGPEEGMKGSGPEVEEGPLIANPNDGGPVVPAGGNKGYAGMEDLFVDNARQSAWNGVKEMLTGGTEPQVYLARTRLSEQEIQRDARIMGRLRWIATGRSDVAYTQWWKYQARISLDGQGRDEAVQMIIAQQVRDMHRMRGPGGALSRANTINRGEQIE